MNTATRLRRVRRELDECAEQVERLAVALDRGEQRVGKGSLVASREISEMTGIKPSTLRTMHTRGQLPPPIAQLSIGTVWLRSDIARWHKKRNGAS